MVIHVLPLIQAKRFSYRARRGQKEKQPLERGQGYPLLIPNITSRKHRSTDSIKAQAGVELPV
jgi:hypothetical protein